MKKIFCKFLHKTYVGLVIKVIIFFMSERHITWAIKTFPTEEQ